MKLLLFAVLLWTCLIPAFALDGTQPASVQITVRDSAGHSLPRAAVTLGTVPVPLNTFGIGESTQSDPKPATDIIWTMSVHVTLPGFLPSDSTLTLFPTAYIKSRVVLYSPRTTLLHVRGPGGQPLAGVAVTLGYSTASSSYRFDGGHVTDTRGDCVLVHPPVTSKITVSLNIGQSRVGPQQDYADAPEITMTLTQAQLPPPLPVHPLQLTLLTSGGTPAAGWQVASQTQFTGSGGAFSSIIFLSNMTNYYTATGLVRLGKDGKAVVPITGEKLAVFSPQGIPLLYPLHPQTWPAGPHSVTLRLPPVLQTQTGRLTYPDGRPGVGIPVEVTEGETGIEKWQVKTREPIGTFLSDTEGRYRLPRYAGTRYQYEARQPPFYAYDLSTADGRVLNDMTQSTGPTPPEVKEVTVQFTDERGQPLPEMDVDTQGQFSSASDTRGVHLFLRKSTDHVDLKTKAENWTPLTKTLPLPGTGDQAFTVTVPESLHFKPLHGVLLAPDGKPVPDVSVSLNGINPRPGTLNNDSLRLSTKTDARGTFTFAAAPNSCEIDLYRFGGDNQPNLPGWTEPLVVMPQTRTIKVTLKPFLTSTVRVLLPPFVKTVPEQVYLESLPAGHVEPDYLPPTFDPKAQTLLWNRIPPGRYTLKTEDKTLPVAARLNQTVTLTEGRQTVIDLRVKVASFPQPPTPATVRINLGNEASGAVVTLWTDQPAYSRHLPADLADDDGEVTLPIGKGQNGVVVAYDAGRKIGEVEVTGREDAGTYSFSMDAVQTLRVPLKPLPLVNGKPPYDSREVLVTPKNLKPGEAQALFLVLGLLDANTGFLGDGLVPSARLTEDAEGVWTALDLPPGTYHVTIGSDITLP